MLIGLEIRSVQIRDYPEVVRISQASFVNPWMRSDFHRALKLNNTFCLVAECGGQVLGFVVAEGHATKLVILNLAVAPEIRRWGVGKALVSRLTGHHVNRRSSVRVEVNEVNLDAQLFFRAMGFKAVEFMRDYYEGGDGAIVFSWSARPLSIPEAAGAVA